MSMTRIFTKSTLGIAARGLWERSLGPFLGKPEDFFRGRPRNRDLDVNAVLAELERSVVLTPCEDSPVFVLSAGWRSGSTLIQRLVQSSRRIHLWGEPYDHVGLVQSLLKLACCDDVVRPPAHFLLNGDQDPFEDRWLANTWPTVPQWFEAQRTFLQATLKVPERAIGAQWGLKEVRYSIKHARFLQMLFPRARFVLLVRHPRDTWNSYREAREWFWEWPNRQIRTLFAFGTMWSTLARSFRTEHQHLRNVETFRYEDLGDQGSLDRLERLLTFKINRSLLTKRIGGSQRRSRYTFLEGHRLRRAVRQELSEWGYD